MKTTKIFIPFFMAMNTKTQQQLPGFAKKTVKCYRIKLGVQGKMIGFFLFFNIVLFNFSTGQSNEYEHAISKFTGDRKYDIERPNALDGVQAPDFQGTTLDGKRISLSDLKGKVVVLNFWFIACTPCRIEVTPLNELVQQYKNKKDVVFLSVAREKEQDLKTHLKSAEFLFQTIADPTSAIGKDIFHLMGYPTTIVIDKAGKIRHYTLGGKIDEAAVRKELQRGLVPAITSCLEKNEENKL